MSIERSIIMRLYESRRVTEAEFNSNGHQYSSHFGRYAKDGEPISREDYFDAKDKGSTSNDPTVVEPESWEGGNPWDDDLFFQNAKRLGLETGDEDLNVGGKSLNFDYAILNKPVKFYHATTSSNVDSISSNGLRSQKQGKDGDKHVKAIYMAGSKDSISKWRGNDTKVISVTLPAGTKVYQDRQSNAVFVTGDIPSEYITIS